MNTSARSSARRQQKFEKGFWILVSVVVAVILWYVLDTPTDSLTLSNMISTTCLMPAWLSLMFSVLHVGKGEMRDKYWFFNQAFRPQPTEYPALYVLRHMVANDDSGAAAPVPGNLDLKGKRAGPA